jgi:hypothetical protein
MTCDRCCKDVSNLIVPEKIKHLEHCSELDAMDIIMDFVRVNYEKKMGFPYSVIGPWGRASAQLTRLRNEKPSGRGMG